MKFHKMKIENNYLEKFKKQNKVYNDTFQEIKPLYRGLLHKKLSYLIIALIFFLLVLNKYLNSEWLLNNEKSYINQYLINYNEKNNENIVIKDIIKNNNDIILLLSFKLYSYLSSSFYHRYPFTNRKTLNIFYKNDLIAISSSIFILPYILCYRLETSLYYLLNYFFFVVNFISTIKDNKYVSSKWDYLRMFNLIIHVIYSLTLAINIITINLNIVVSFFNYFLCICCYGLKQLNIKPMIWHKPLIYGFHEDFHFFLLIADIFMILSFIKYQYRSAI